MVQDQLGLHLRLLDQLVVVLQAQLGRQRLLPALQVELGQLGHLQMQLDRQVGQVQLVHPHRLLDQQARPDRQERLPRLPDRLALLARLALVL